MLAFSVQSDRNMLGPFLLVCATAGGAGPPAGLMPPPKPELTLLHRIEHGLEAVKLAASPDSSTVATLGYLRGNDEEVSPALRFWDLKSGKKSGEILWKKNSPPIVSVVFAPDGKTVITVALDGVVTVWSRRTLKAVRTLEAPREARTLAYSPDGRFIAVGSSLGKVHVWETKSWSPHCTLAVPGGKDSEVWAACFSPCGQHYAVVLSSAVIHMWECKSWKKQWSIDAGLKDPDIEPGFYYVDALFAPNSRYLAGIIKQPHESLTVGKHKVPPRGVTLFDTRSGKAVAGFGLQITGARAAAFSLDGRWGFSAGTNPGPAKEGLVTVTDLHTGNVCLKKTCFNNALPGKMIVTQSGKTLIVSRNDSTDAADPDHILVFSVAIGK